MMLDKPCRLRFWVTLALFVVAFVAISASIFYSCRRMAIAEAEKKLSGFLLNYSATRNFVEDVQKQELYRLKSEQRLYREYFSPKLLSSTYITRHINNLQNQNRQKAGLDQVYFKFASRNPRNPVNLANAFELKLLDEFNEGLRTEYKAIVERGTEKTLYYSVPIDRNREACMRCHGDPADAPLELVVDYGSSAGFHEQLGEIRALMSVHVPVDRLLAEANRTAVVLSAVVLLLLAGAFWGVQLLFGKAEVQQAIAEEKSSYLNSVLQSTTDTAIIALDKDCSIKYFNRAAEQLCAVSAEEALNRRLPELPALACEKAGELLRKALEIVNERGVYRFRFTLKERILEAQLSQIRSSKGNGAGFLFLGQDITTHIMEQREREAIKSRLQKAEKTESIGLLAGGVAHDLNNILTGIISYPELLLLRLPEDSELRAPITAIQQSGQRAAAVVADLLTVARGVACQKETAELNALARDYLDSPEFDKLQTYHPTVQAVVELADQPLHIVCSPIHIRKCLMNLIGNAFEASPAEGVCRIVSGWRHFDLAAARKNYLSAGDYAFICISNKGEPIREKDLKHIFEPFYSTKKLGRSGTGLGLSVVYNTVKDHQGSVIVNSGPEETSFSIYFPLTSANLKTPARDISVTSMEGNQEVILIVDDEPQLRDIAEKMLLELNYGVVTAASGEEALQYLQRNSVDLVLLDMLMAPGISGLATYQALLKIHPQQKTIIVSGFSDNEEINQALSLGANGFLSKPYSLEQLGQALVQVLRA